jgi:hypothetical protein
MAEKSMNKWSQELNRISHAMRVEMGGGGSAQTIIYTAVSSLCLPRRYIGYLSVWEYLVRFGEMFGPEFSDNAASLVRMLLADIFANPFRPITLDSSWLTSTVVALATGIYNDRAFDRMPILADALQDAGCENEEILNHCRGEGPHVLGCWLLDLILKKE